jgi:hypothetical protein
MTPSAVGDRQMFPMHTNRIRIAREGYEELADEIAGV